MPCKGDFSSCFYNDGYKRELPNKKYTAYREGLTEIIAIPVYYTSGVISRAISDKISVPKNFMSKRIYGKYKSGDTSAEVKDAVKHAEEMAKISLPKIKTTSAFIGVCASALLIIPLLCSVTIKPIMKALEKENSKPDESPNVMNPKKPNIKLNSYKNLYVNNSYGMKVGSL